MKQERAVSSRRVKELISIAQKAGLKHLKVGEIELEFGPQSRLHSSVDKPSKLPETKVETLPTDEELLNWSSPHFDHLEP